MSRESRRLASVAAVLVAATEPVVETTTELVPEVTAPKSIRQLCMTAILAGVSTKDIAASIQLHFPLSMAASKSTKHIAWYRSRMKKDGLLTAKVAEAVVEAEVPATE